MPLSPPEIALGHRRGSGRGCQYGIRDIFGGLRIDPPTPAPAGARAGRHPGATLAPPRQDGCATVATDGGITLGELAEVRGVSKDAARRLVKAGKVAAHQTAGSYGPA